MIKIKVNESSDYIKNSLKCRNYSALEGIVLLDIAIEILEKDFELSDNQIWEILKEYRSNLKEVE